MQIIIFKTALDATAVHFHVHAEMCIYIHLAFVNPRVLCKSYSYPVQFKEILCKASVTVGSQLVWSGCPQIGNGECEINKDKHESSLISWHIVKILYSQRPSRLVHFTQ